MKKIAIVTRRMVFGGIEKSIIAMLEAIPKDEFEVTLYVMGKGGELEKDIPNGVKLKCLYGDENSTIEKVVKSIKSGKFVTAFKTIYYTFLYRTTKSVFEQEMYHSKMLGMESEEYDLAIANHVPASFPVVYVVNNLKAKKRVAWIHSDVSRYKEQLDRYKEFYKKYDKIFSVSVEAKDKFANMYPEFKNKLDVFYNIISKDELVNRASEAKGFDDNYSGKRILTIGRLCDEKGQKLIPHIAKKMIENGYKFKWYCIGEGEYEYENKIKSEIKKYNLSDVVIFLGTKYNPYPYLKQCDIYVQPSKFECYCTTVTEAKCFYKPMVITNVNGSNEQIINNKTGLIVESDVDDIYRGIELLLNDETLTSEIINNLSKIEVDTKKEIEKLYELFT